MLIGRLLRRCVESVLRWSAFQYGEILERIFENCGQWDAETRQTAKEMEMEMEMDLQQELT